MSRRVTLALTGGATALLVAAVLVLDRTSAMPLLPAALILGGLALGSVAVSRAWARQASSLAQPSADGSAAGPT